MSRTVMLTMDGEPIVMKSMRISASMQFQDKDNSGQTSSTSSSEQGRRPRSSMYLVWCRSTMSRP